MPNLDGENDRDLNDLVRGKWVHGPAEQAAADVPKINAHSPEGAALDAIKEQRPVEYVPNAATLDPVSNNPDRLK
jgi:hypothetical protein